MFFFRKGRNELPPVDSLPSPARGHIKREHDRFDYHTPITYENAETKEMIRGFVQNYSKKGFYIETRHCPAVGIGALIYMDQYAPDSPGPENLKRYHVQVRWVKQLPEPNEENRYGIGVRHCADVDELFRLFGH